MYKKAYTIILILALVGCRTVSPAPDFTAVETSVERVESGVTDIITEAEKIAQAETLDQAKASGVIIAEKAKIAQAEIIITKQEIETVKAETVAQAQVLQETQKTAEKAKNRNKTLLIALFATGSTLAIVIGGLIIMRK